MNNSNSYRNSNIGIVTLLMVFIVLCLTIFAPLTLSGAFSDYNYTKTLAKHTTAYYEASNKAQEVIAAINSDLADAEFPATTSTDGKSTSKTYMKSSANVNEGSDKITEDTQQRYTNLLNNFDFIKKVSVTRRKDSNKNLILSWQIPMDDSHALQVKMEVAIDGNNTTDRKEQSPCKFVTKITSYKEISTMKWTGDNTINLIQ